MTAALLTREETDRAVQSERAFTIRRFTPDDYPALVAVHNAAWPDYADTVDEWKFNDANREPKVRWARFVAEDSATGEIIGMASYGQHTDMYHPQKFNVNSTILPERRRQGIGGALYETLTAALAEFDPICIRAQAREDFPDSLNFLQKRGFVEEMRDWESRLDVAAFDFAPFAEAEKRVADAGIVLKTLAELRETEPEWKEKYYDIEWTIIQDMPAPDTLTQFSYEHFVKSTLENPNFSPESIFIALDGDYWVGESALWKSQADANMFQGGTGVRREYRRKGIALALKLRGLAYAKENNVPQIKTWNNQTNRAMLSINEAMGFAKQPAWINFVKNF